MSLIDLYREIPLHQLLSIGLSSGSNAKNKGTTGNVSDSTNSDDVANMKITSIAAVNNNKFRDVCYLGTNNGYVYEFQFEKFAGLNESIDVHALATASLSAFKEDSIQTSSSSTSPKSIVNTTLESSTLSDIVKERFVPDLKSAFLKHESLASQQEFNGVNEINDSNHTKTRSRHDSRSLSDIVECVGIYHISTSSIEQIECVDYNDSGKAMLLVQMDSHLHCVELIPPNRKNDENLKIFRMHPKIGPTKGTSRFTMNLGRINKVNYTSYEDEQSKDDTPQVCCLVKKKLVFFDVSISESALYYLKAINLSQGEPIRFIWRDNIISLFYGSKSIDISYQTGEPTDELKDLSIYSLLLRNSSKSKSAQKKFTTIVDFFPIFGAKSDSKSVQWTDILPKSILVQYPYIIGLSSSVIEILSIHRDILYTFSKEDGNQFKFSKPIGGAISNHIIYAASQSSLFIMTPLPHLELVRELILSSKQDDSQSLYEYVLRKRQASLQQILLDNANGQNDFLPSSQQKVEKDWLLDFYLISGWVSFKNLNFKAAAMNFQFGQLPATSLLRFFPDLLHPDYIPPTNDEDFANVYLPHLNTIGHLIEYNISNSENESEKHATKFSRHMKQARNMLLEYLKMSKSTSIQDETERNTKFRFIDNAICKLYIASNNIEQLKSFLLEPNHLEIEDVERNIQEAPSINEAKRCLAFIMWNKGQKDKALDLLQSLYNVEEDEEEGSLIDLIQLLEQCTDNNLVWRYIPHIIDRNPYKGIEVLTNESSFLAYDPELVLPFLQTRSNLAQVLYYEYLISVKRYSDSQTHTRYLLLLIESVLKILPESLPGIIVRNQQGLVGEYRFKILSFLKNSKSNYNPKKILKALQETQLYEEMIEVYKKISDHESVLKLLVHQIQDFKWAEAYCLEVYEENRMQYQLQKENSFSGPSNKQVNEHEDNGYNPLLLTLLKLYFDDKDKWKYGIQLLKAYNSHIDSVQVLEILPDELPLSDFLLELNEMIQDNITEQRSSSIFERLLQHEYFRLHSVLAQTLSKKVTIEEYSKCSVCDKLLGSSAIAILPDLTCVHIKCLSNPRLKNFSFSR